MHLICQLILLSGLLFTQIAAAHGPGPVSLQRVPIPPVPGLLDGAEPIVVNKEVAIALGKALFWDMNVGSDGMACGSCHFRAGVDGRIKNQINPGGKSSKSSGHTFDSLPSGGGGPNHTLSLHDFPLHQFNNPADKYSGIAYTTDDVVASAGTFSGQFSGVSRFSGANDQCVRSADPETSINHVGTRRVEPRNTPTMINAVFNHRNFWDGRANNIFNGSSPWGERDPNAGVWEKINARTVAKQRLHLENSSLASLATAPPLSNFEMSCEKRSWPDIGRKLLSRQPLQNQQVHHQDSVLGPYSRSSEGNLQPGLNTVYKNLITQAFNAKYWSFAGIGQFGGPVGQLPYNQMEANFSMFFGLAVQLYISTLVSDQSPFDLSPVDANLRPTWTNIVAATPAETAAKIASLKNGSNLFFNNHCNLCHTGPNISLAAVAANAALVKPVQGSSFGPPATPIDFGPNALGPDNAAYAAGITQYENPLTRDFNLNIEPRLMDLGYTNTGVADPDADPGVGGVDDFGHPLSFTAQYVSYLLADSSGVFDSVVNHTRSCDFIVPLAAHYEFSLYDIFTVPDGIIVDGSREGEQRTQNCMDPGTNAYIPTVAAAQDGLSGPKMAIATKAAFKIPSLRNIELTGPYMHNGSMATLQQVLQFYARQGNFENDNLHFNVSSVSSSVSSAKNSADLIAYLKTFTDERVRYEKAPFDHPQLLIPHGHTGNALQVTAGNPINANLAQDEYLNLPAVGANGVPTPIAEFSSILQ